MHYANVIKVGMDFNEYVINYTVIGGKNTGVGMRKNGKSGGFLTREKRCYELLKAKT